VDGRSFLPLFESPEQAWRESFLVERRQFEAQYVELAERFGLAPGGLDQAAQFDAIRTADWTYVEYGTGERELYDLARDPHQLDNVVETADPDPRCRARGAPGRTAHLPRRGLPPAGGPWRPLDNTSPKLAAQPQ
jgi:hypothetical protein